MSSMQILVVFEESKTNVEWIDGCGCELPEVNW